MLVGRDLWEEEGGREGTVDVGWFGEAVGLNLKTVDYSDY